MDYIVPTGRLERDVQLNTSPRLLLLFAAAFASILLATAWVGSVPTKDDFDPGVALTFLADGRLLAAIAAWILAAANVDGTLFGSRFLVWAAYAASCLVYISTVQRSLAPSQSERWETRFAFVVAGTAAVILFGAAAARTLWYEAGTLAIATQLLTGALAVASLHQRRIVLAALLSAISLSQYEPLAPICIGVPLTALCLSNHKSLLRSLAIYVVITVLAYAVLRTAAPYIAQLAGVVPSSRSSGFGASILATLQELRANPLVVVTSRAYRIAQGPGGAYFILGAAAALAAALVGHRQKWLTLPRAALVATLLLMLFNPAYLLPELRNSVRVQDVISASSSLLLVVVALILFSRSHPGSTPSGRAWAIFAVSLALCAAFVLVSGYLQVGNLPLFGRHVLLSLALYGGALIAAHVLLHRWSDRDAPAVEYYFPLPLVLLCMLPFALGDATRLSESARLATEGYDSPLASEVVRATVGLDIDLLLLVPGSNDHLGSSILRSYAGAAYLQHLAGNSFVIRDLRVKRGEPALCAGSKQLASGGEFVMYQVESGAVAVCFN